MKLVEKAGETNAWFVADIKLIEIRPGTSKKAWQLKLHDRQGQVHRASAIPLKWFHEEDAFRRSMSPSEYWLPLIRSKTARKTVTLLATLLGVLALI